MSHSRQSEADSQPSEVIAAFVDGEPVDPRQLANALAQAEGREHLIDLLVLRELVGGQNTARPALMPSTATRSASHLRRLAVAASLAAVSVLGGYFLGQRTAESPAAVVRAPASDVAPVSAPAPTRVIRLENGVDWNERTGGG